MRIYNKTVTVCCVLVFLLIFPAAIFAQGKYGTITAAVPVSFFASGQGANSCTTVMETVNDSPKPYNDTLKFGSSGTDKFEIDINEPGTYRYKVYQIPGEQGGIVYDNTVYDVIVFVSVTDSDMLKYAVTAVASDTGKKPDKIEFVNSVKGDDDSKKESGGGTGTDSKEGRDRGKSVSVSELRSVNKTDGTDKTDDNGNTDNNGSEDNSNTDENNGIDPNENNSDHDQNDNNGSNTDNTAKNGGTQIDDDGTGVASAGRGGFENQNVIDTVNDNNNNDNKNDDPSDTSNVVNTGDTNRQGIWLTVMCLSAAVFVMSFILEYAEKKKKIL